MSDFTKKTTRLTLGDPAVIEQLFTQEGWTTPEGTKALNLKITNLEARIAELEEDEEMKRAVEGEYEGVE